jgi:hypothetical protein
MEQRVQLRSVQSGAQRRQRGPADEPERRRGYAPTYGSNSSTRSADSRSGQVLREPNRMWGLTKTDQEWSDLASLQATIDAADAVLAALDGVADVAAML